MINTGWILTVTAVSIYTISFAVYEIKNKKFSSGIFTIFLILCAVVLSIVRILSI